MTTTFTGSLLEDLGPFVTPETDPTGDHETYLSALAAMFEEMYGLVIDQNFPDDPDWIPGWSVPFDPDACATKFLPYLAQFNGTDIPAGSDDATARAIIFAESGMVRGTAETMMAAAKRHMTGTQTLAFLERTAADGSADAYHVLLGYLMGEVADPAGLIAAVEAVKPGGIQVTYSAIAAGYTWNAAIHKWSADAFPWAAALYTQP